MMNTNATGAGAPAVSQIEAVRSVLFPDGDAMMVVQLQEPDPDKLVTSAEEAVAFLDGHPGNFLLQTFAADREPMAYLGLAAVMTADHYLPPTIILQRAEDSLRVGIWRLATPIAVTDQKQVETLEDIARGLGNEKAADAAPMPGTDGWSIAENVAERAYSLDQMKRAPVHLHGTLDPDLLARPLALSMSPLGENTPRGKWHATKMTVQQFIYMLGGHEAGSKEGNCILQGVAARRVREAKMMESLSILGLDLDTGESIEQRRAKIKQQGWFALIHTSHSHLKRVSDPKKDAVMEHVGRTEGEPTLEECVRFLREVKRVQSWVLEGATLEGKRVDGGTTHMLVRHLALPKYRVLFVLENRFIPTDRGGKDSAGRAEWAERYAGVSEVLGAYYDRSCTDVSRLFFTARHPADAVEWQTEVIAGSPLNLDKVARVRKGHQASNNPFSDNARDMGEDGKDREGKRFFARFGHLVELETAFLHYDPDGDRGPRNGPGRHHRCPYEDEHTPTSDGRPDVGFFCLNPDDSEPGGAVAHCMHDGCAGRDRIDFTAKLLEDAGKTWEDLEKDYIPETIEDHEKQGPKPATMGDAPARPKQSSQAEKSDPDNETLFQEFSKEWAYVAEGPSGRFVKALPDGILEFKGVDALDKLYAHKPVFFLDQHGKPKPRPLVKEWIKWPGSEGRKYSGIRFAPGKKDSEIAPYLNTWRGLGVVPKPGSWSKMRQHVEEVLANGSEKDARILIGWMAHVLQHLGDTRKKLTISPVLRGIEGAGKSMVFDYYSRIFGRHGLALSKPEQIVGRFNASLGEALFVQLEEAFFAGDPKIDGPLKDLLTGKEMQIERKNIDPISAPNFAHFVVISNAERPVPIKEGSRRYYPIECSEAKANQAAWFDPIIEEMENGGVEAMAWDLLRWSPADGDWRFLREFPRTEAGDRMIAAGLSPLERFILTWAWEGGSGYGAEAPLLHGTGDADISTAQMAQAFADWAEENVRARHERDGIKTDGLTVGLQLRKMLPLVEKGHGDTGNGRRFPCRARVVEMLRMHPNGGYRAFLDSLEQAEA